MERPDFAHVALPHLDALYRTARRLTARQVEAEDLVQQTYLEGHRSFASLKDTDRCRAWLFRILHNLWFHHRTRESDRARAREIRGREAGEGQPDLETELMQASYSEEVEHALQALPEELRTALLLVTVEEMTYAEVAEAMSCPIGTVRSRVARARAHLAQELGAATAPLARKRGP